MINKTTYTNWLEPEDRVWEAEQVEYCGYDPVVSAVRGRRREGFPVPRGGASVAAGGGGDYPDRDGHCPAWRWDF